MNRREAPIGPEAVAEEPPKKPRIRKPRTEIRLSNEVRDRVEKMCQKLGVSQNFLYVHAIARNVVELERLMENVELSVSEEHSLVSRREVFEHMLAEITNMYNSYADRTGFTVETKITNL